MNIRIDCYYIIGVGSHFSYSVHDRKVFGQKTERFIFYESFIIGNNFNVFVLKLWKTHD
ncbi:hypothetical protein J26TS2_31270 [Shouchella clausii]|nr:hypothetical protein J26TS2_31270 [Shouchella clausii]